MASSEITFKITGAENLKRLKANNLLMTPLRNYFNASGKIIKEKSKEHAPVDTGALRKTIKYTRIKNTGRIPNQVKIYATAKHASFVHGNPNKKFRMSEPFNRTRPHFPPVKALTGWSKKTWHESLSSSYINCRKRNANSSILKNGLQRFRSRA